jgi:hypothetical protein
MEMAQLVIQINPNMLLTCWGENPSRSEPCAPQPTRSQFPLVLYFVRYSEINFQIDTHMNSLGFANDNRSPSRTLWRNQSYAAVVEGPISRT